MSRNVMVDGLYSVNCIFTPESGRQRFADVVLALIDERTTAATLAGYAQAKGWGRLVKVSMCVNNCDQKDELPSWYNLCNGKLYADTLDARA